jgi:environmental stress-induced protein Ves
VDISIAKLAAEAIVTRFKEQQRIIESLETKVIELELRISCIEDSIDR